MPPAEFERQHATERPAEHDRIARHVRIHGAGEPGDADLSYTYDALGRLAARTDAAGTWAWAYAGNTGRVLTLTDPDGNVVSYTYDAAGNRTKMVRGATATDYAYDADDRLVSRVTGAATVSYGWDANGNLASRTVKLVHNAYAGATPPEWAPEAFADPAVREAFDALTAAAAAAAEEVPRAADEIRLDEAMASAWRVVERANEFVDRSRPWDLAKDPGRRAELGTALNALLETLRLIAVWAWPVMPGKCEELWRLLGLPGTPGEQRGAAARPAFGAPAGRALGQPVILFPRIDLKAAGTPGAEPPPPPKAK